VAVGRANAETTIAAVEGQFSYAQIYAGEACDTVIMIENDSSVDETSDEQDDDSEEDEYGE